MSLPDATTLVLWDYKACPIRSGEDNVCAEKITNWVRGLNCHGPVIIKAYGTSELISDELKQAMESQGIIVTLVPTGPAARNAIKRDALRWARENPPSNVIFII